MRSGESADIPLVFDADGKTIRWSGGSVRLGNIPFRLLKELFHSKKRCLSVTRITKRVWHNELFNHSTVKATLSKLRGALRDAHCPYHIVSVNIKEVVNEVVNPITKEKRQIVALARIGGLRCPSELRNLRWRDVNWEQNRFLVHEPKVEHHAGRGERIVPLFPELRAELDRHFLSDVTVGNEFVIQSWQGTTWVLYTGFQQIACNAGIGTIVRPFDNMRMSRSNEVLRQFGDVKESLWIGHSTKVMKDHYLRLSDADFMEAAGESSVGQTFHVKFHAVSDCQAVQPARE